MIRTLDALCPRRHGEKVRPPLPVVWTGPLRTDLTGLRGHEQGGARAHHRIACFRRRPPPPVPPSTAARTFGIAGLRPSSADDLYPTLMRALEVDGPAFVEVPIDYRENLRLTERLGALPGMA